MPIEISAKGILSYISLSDVEDRIKRNPISFHFYIYI